MSGGGKGAAPQPQPKYVSLPMETIQPFMPGMDQVLANQLSAGFGGSPQNYLSAFNQTYAPMQVPDYTNWNHSPVPAVKTKI